MDLGEMARDYYCKRFKIETLFKQLKSAGFCLHQSKVESPGRVKNLLIVVDFAFIFTFCIGILLKNGLNETVGEFARKDRIDLTRPITLAQKCILKAMETAKLILSKLFKELGGAFHLTKSVRLEILLINFSISTAQNTMLDKPRQSNNS